MDKGPGPGGPKKGEKHKKNNKLRHGKKQNDKKTNLKNKRKTTMQTQTNQELRIKHQIPGSFMPGRHLYFFVC